MSSQGNLRTARVAVAAAFFAQGFVYISLTTRLPRFQELWLLDEVTLSLLLLMMVLLAGLGSVVAEPAARRLGSATVLRAGLLLAGAAVPVLVLAPSQAVFVAAMAAYGVALGVVDAASNMQAVAIEHRAGRPILPSTHGYWTIGGVLAAAAALAFGGLPVAASAVVAVVPLAIAFAPFLARVTAGVTTPGGATGPASGAIPVAVPVPWRPIVLVGLGLVVFYMVDTAATTWGPSLLAREFDTPSNLVALATFPYLVATMLTRLAGDRLVVRFGVAPVLRVGALVACAALALVVLAPSWQVAVVGFTLLGVGVAVVAPLSFSAAARIAGGGRERVDAVIARFNQFNYAGALLGSVLTGLVGSDSLRVGFVLPAVLVLALVPLARAFAAPPRVL
ncbi:MFS transporter [Antribacter gilvus]|uniref:MFS transporter n=1 Tax=Antribacter gilvus TaxID=2304675 RepID=UPI000F7B6B7B|nr:MFS transporter [Antribacter gilvus]